MLCYSKGSLVVDYEVLFPNEISLFKKGVYAAALLNEANNNGTVSFGL